MQLLPSPYRMATVGCTASREQRTEMISDSHFGASSTRQRHLTLKEG